MKRTIFQVSQLQEVYSTKVLAVCICGYLNGGEVVVKQSSYTVYMLGVLKILNYQIVHELETDDIEQDDIEKHVYQKNIQINREIDKQLNRQR